jgi:formate dehydrogenase maturation protein FdhE
MPRNPLSDRPLTNAERQARYRRARAAAQPTIRYRRAADRRSRAQRWRDAVAELVALQNEYARWFEAVPENLRENATGEALQAIVDLDLDELSAIVPPRGFGRD